MRTTLTLRLFLCLTVFFFNTPVFADDTLNKQAHGFIKEGKFKEALPLLKQQITNNTANTETYFLLGVSHNRLRNFSEAIKHLTTAIEQEPNQGQIRLELALAYYSQGTEDSSNQDLEDAKTEFLTVKKQPNLPDSVDQKIDSYLGRIAQLQNNGFPKNWSVNVSLGYLNDSNANAATDEDEVLIFNLPFTLSDDAKETADNAYKYQIGFQHSKNFTNSLQLRSNLGVSQTDYQKLNTLDLLSLNASFGLFYKSGSITYGLPLTYNRLKVGHAQDYYNQTRGISPQMLIAFGKNSVWDNHFVLQERQYKTATTRDGISVSYRPSFKYYFSQNDFIGIGSSIGKELSKEEINSNSTHSFRLEYNTLFWNALSLYIAPSYNETKYDEKEASYDEIRHDKASSIYTNLSYRFTGYKGFKPNLSLNYSHTKNDSNLPIYTYKRQQIGLTLNVSY